MIDIKTLTVGGMRVNCYLVIDRESEQVLIIDPGGDAYYIINVISGEDVTPTKIVATHGHFDHILSVTEIKLAYGIPFLMHKNDEFLLRRVKKSALYYAAISADPPSRVEEYLNEGDLIYIGKNKFKVLETFGHTPGSISLYSKKYRCIFVGDVIFARGSFGRYDFKYSDGKKLKKSIKKILSLPKDTIIYSGHGEKTTVGHEQIFFK